MYGWRMLGIYVSGVEDLGKDCSLIDAAAAVHVVRRFHVGSALVGCLEANLLADVRRPVDLLALGAEIETAAYHIACKLHVLVNRIIDRLDTVCVVHSEFWVVGRLNRFTDDTVANTKRVEDKWSSTSTSICDQCILFVKVVVERWTIMATVRLSPEVERLVRHLSVQLRKSAEKTLENVPCSHGCHVCRANRGRIVGPFSSHTTKGSIFNFTCIWIDTTRLFFGV